MTRISLLHAIERKRMCLRMITPLVILVAIALGFVPVSANSVSKRSGSTDNAPAKIQSQGLTDPDEFAAFLDPLVEDLMTANHIPGGAIAVVKNGQLFYAKGYGFADLESRTPATADTTIFRTGSVSKVFTWTAVMQLVEQGRLDLNADVNTYLTHFQIPATFAQPITLSHLMTHTAGFEDQISNGMLFASPDTYQPLQDFLMEKMPARIYPPGEVVAYSNYGATLAGQIVAEVSGEAFDQYISQHIFEPLEMNHSTFLQPIPANLAQTAAVGYDSDASNLPQAASFEFVQVQPAGALSATATDIANFMIAHLQDGQFRDERILQPASAQDMRRQHYAFNPRLPGITRGFFEANRNNIHLVLHSGTTDRSASLLALMPEQGLGFFITFNSYISISKRMALLNMLLDHYYPELILPVNSSPANFTEQNTNRLSGNYLISRRAETNIEKLKSPLSEVSVKSSPDGTLKVNAFRDSNGDMIRWIQVAPLVFQEAGGQSLLAFRADAQGKVTAMFHGDQPILMFQRLAWHEDPQNHLAGLGLTLLVFIATGLVWSMGALLRLVRHKPISSTRLERWSRFLAGGLILLNLVIVGLVISVLVGDDSFIQFGYPAGFSAAGTLALISAAGSIVLLACTAGVWRERAWGVVGRLHYTLVAVAALYFVFYLNNVNILQLQL